jgi:hypothetical protein
VAFVNNGMIKRSRVVILFINNGTNGCIGTIMYLKIFVTYVMMVNDDIFGIRS